MLSKMINPEDWLAALNNSGFRVTAVQADFDRYLRTQRVSAQRRAGLGCRPASRARQTGRATVYRMVEKLENLGLIRRVHGYQGCSLLCTNPA